jgi:ribosomal protein S18 acetylase RimI-like enzyme
MNRRFALLLSEKYNQDRKICFFMETEIGKESKNSYQIVAANWRDLNALRNLEKICFPKDSWPLLDLVGVLTLPNVVRLKAIIAEQMVGFIAGDVKRAEQIAWIATIGVLPEYRRRGIGLNLLKECETRVQIPRMRLCVRISNQAAIQLYETYGYQRINIWKHYYYDGEDAAVMEKWL